MRYFSLFSGIGGFELGIQCAEGGRQCVGYSEIEPDALAIYRKHFQSHLWFGDARHISERDLPHFDALVAGFPCQTFSSQGYRDGFVDARGQMFFEVLRLARVIQPRLLLLENVAGLLSHDVGRTFERMLRQLDAHGYDAEWEVLNSKYFGVAQSRERVFIVGHLRGASRPGVFPLGYRDEAILGSGDNSIRLLTHSRSWRSAAIHSPRAVIPTLTVGGDPLMVWDGQRVRLLSGRECERLQGFPIDWTSGFGIRRRKELLGNAVTVPVVQVIVERLIALGLWRKEN